VVPALIGLAACWGLLYVLLRSSLPKKIARALTLAIAAPCPPLRHPHAVRRHHSPRPPHPPGPRPFPVLDTPDRPSRPGQTEKQPDLPFMWFAVGMVVIVRAGFFVAALAEIPPYAVAVVGACILLLANSFRRAMDTPTAVKKAPWAILGFAFGMDLVVFGLGNAGLIAVLADHLDPAVRTSALGASLLPGLVVATVSSLLNNHPGLIIGSLTLLGFTGLAQPSFDTAYASMVLGSDLGALLTPIGTLASLIWFHLLRQSGHRYTWWDYLKITGTVIPVSFALALCGLYVTAVLKGV
jgi:arsenical pump membrane protein